MDSQTPHDVIAQVLCGELSASDPGFVQALERDPGLRARWERLRALTSALDDMGAAERAARGGLTPMPEAEERVAQLVRRHFAPRTPRRGWLWGSLLAAGLALTLWLLSDTDPTGSARPTTRGLDSLVLDGGQAVITGMSAQRLGDGSYRLDWADTEPAFGRTYFVRLHQRDGDVLGATLEALGSPELTNPSWSLSLPSGYDPQRLGWSVEVRDADRNPIATSAVQPLASP